LKALEGVLSRYMGEGERRVVVRHTVPVSSDRARFDPQFLVDQFQDDVPQVYEILETFLEDVFTFRKRLEKMIRTRSMDDLGVLGRVLQEVAGNVGAHSLASLGVEFQRIRCNPEAGALAVALEDLKSELEWLTGELQGGNEAAAPRRPRPRKDP
jgi:hypothetical protein